MPAASTPILLSAANRYLTSSAQSARLRFPETGGPPHQRYATFGLTADGLLVDRRTRDAYFAVDGGTLARRPLLGATPDRDRFTRDGAHLVHRDSGKRLAVRSSTDGAATLVLDDTADAEPVSASGMTLITDVLAQTPEPYPPFTTAGTIAAYAYACTLWNVSDIRTEYTNVNYDVGAQTYLLADAYFPQDPSGFVLSDWQSVCNTLNAEIAAVQNVRLLYKNFGDFNQAVFSTNNTILNSIQADLDVADTTSFTIWPFEMVEGIMYTLLNLMGPESAFIANLMAAAFSTATSMGSFSSEPIEDEYANLLQDLLNQYDAVTSAAAQQQTTILSDWGMTSAVSTYCGGPLASNSIQQSAARTNAQNAFGAYALQGFLPRVAQISMNLFNSGSTTAANAAQWVQALTPDLYNVWSVALGESGNVVPSTTMNYVWSAGVRPQDFFYGQNGWNIPRDPSGTVVNGWSGTLATDNDAVLLLLISNDTDQDLSVDVTPALSATGQTFLTPQPLSLPANQSTLTGVADSDGVALNLGVYWSGYTSGSVASLEAFMSVNTARGGGVIVPIYNHVDNFVLTFRTVDPSFVGAGYGLPGLCVISVTQS